jgi:hypothetical protein
VDTRFEPSYVCLLLLRAILTRYSRSKIATCLGVIWTHTRKREAPSEDRSRFDNHPRPYHCVCAPHTRSILVIILCRFGGNDSRHYYNDTWSFDISTRKWTELQCTGSIPSPRRGHAAVLVDDVMYVFGGSTNKTVLDDLYALQLSSE